MLASMNVFAQRAVGSWNIQPKLGLNIASMTDSEDTDARIAFAVGAEAEYQATDMVSFSAGALYSQQGIKSPSSEVDVTIKMDYINIPILANVYVAKGFAVKLGLQPGFLINDKAKVSSNGASAEMDLTAALQAEDATAKVNSFDLSLPVGISYEFSNIQVDARYNWGLTKAISAQSGSTKHSVFQFTVGYKFSL